MDEETGPIGRSIARVPVPLAGQEAPFRVKSQQIAICEALEADHAGSYDTAKSTSGWTIELVADRTKELMDWCSRLQGATAKSTPEAETVAHADMVTRG